jgi:transposase
MNRHALTKRQWERVQPLLPPQKPPPGRPAADHRRILNGILWLIRTGAPWRDVPERYGSWQTMASRFYRSGKMRQSLRHHGSRITIARKQHEPRTGPCDRAISRLRERVERLSNRLKQRRRLATRDEKGAVNYHAMWLIAATLWWL